MKIKINKKAENQKSKDKSIKTTGSVSIMGNDALNMFPKYNNLINNFGEKFNKTGN